MTKKLLSFALSMVLLISSFSLFAQNDKLDIGDFENTTSKFEGSIDQKAPFVFCYNYSVTQQIYTADELKSINGKNITSLELRSFLNVDYDHYESDVTYNIKVYLKEIQNSTYTKNDNNEYEWVQVNDNDLYYNKPLTINFASMIDYNDEGDYNIKFDLDKEFQYNGSNLMFMVVMYTDDENRTEGSFNDFYCYPANVKNKPITTLYLSNYKSTFDTQYPTTTKSNALKQRAVLNIYNQSRIGTGIESSKLEIIELISISEHTINVTNKNVNRIEVFDTKGSLIANQNTALHSQLYLENDGIYIVRLTTKNGEISTTKIEIK